jgi:hypothetical protein
LQTIVRVYIRSAWFYSKMWCDFRVYKIQHTEFQTMASWCSIVFLFFRRELNCHSITDTLCVRVSSKLMRQVSILLQAIVFFSWVCQRC